MFHKYTKIKALGDPANEGIFTIPGKVVIQEKIDGANFAFYVENDILHFCSHNKNLTDSNQITETEFKTEFQKLQNELYFFSTLK